MIQLVLILGVLVFGGIAGGGGIWWLQHEAVATCNADWKREIADANFKLEQAGVEKANALRAAEEAAQQQLAESERKLVASQQELELARSATPLSEPCDACRVPGSRIWGLRGAERGPDGIDKAPGVVGNRQKTDAPNKDGAMPRRGKGAVHGPRIGARAGMRARPKSPE